jgi:hypothetical protein
MSRHVSFLMVSILKTTNLGLLCCAGSLKSEEEASKGKGFSKRNSSKTQKEWVLVVDSRFLSQQKQKTNTRKELMTRIAFIPRPRSESRPP